MTNMKFMEYWKIMSYRIKVVGGGIFNEHKSIQGIDRVAKENGIEVSQLSISIQTPATTCQTFLFVQYKPIWLLFSQKKGIKHCRRFNSFQWLLSFSTMRKAATLYSSQLVTFDKNVSRLRSTMKRYLNDRFYIQRSLAKSNFKNILKHLHKRR